MVDGHLWERATAAAFGKCAHGCSVRRQLGPVTFHDSLGWGLYAYVARETEKAVPGVTATISPRSARIISMYVRTCSA